MDLVRTLAAYAEQPLTHQLLVSVLKKYERPNDKILGLAKMGILQPVKRGLYVAGPALGVNRRPEPFLIANLICGPSYVSVESALAHHGLIPERVFVVASMTTKLSRAFTTPIGRYTYTKLSVPYYSKGVRMEQVAENQVALVASPEKALCDKIVTTAGLLLRSKKSARAFLLDNLRMEPDDLRQFDLASMLSWASISQKEESITKVVEAIRDL